MDESLVRGRPNLPQDLRYWRCANSASGARAPVSPQCAAMLERGGLSSILAIRDGPLSCSNAAPSTVISFDLKSRLRRPHVIRLSGIRALPTRRGALQPDPLTEDGS